MNSNDPLKQKIAALNSDVRKLHYERARPVDVHLHPLMSQQLFGTNLNIARRFWRRFSYSEAPWIARASFPALTSGGWQVILANTHVPERKMAQDFPILWLGRFLADVLRYPALSRDAFSVTKGLMARLEHAIESPPFWAQDRSKLFCMVKSVGELRAHLKRNANLPVEQHSTAIIHAVEGGHSINPDIHDEPGTLGRLHELFDKGVAYLILTHFYANGIASPSYPFPNKIPLMINNSHEWWNLTDGLGPLGHAVVEEMLKLGMLIDMSHCTPTARRQIIKIVQSKQSLSGVNPGLIMSHVGAYGINPTAYNPTDKDIADIANLGGVVGVIWMNYWLSPGERLQGIDAVIQTLKHIVNAGGRHCASIGTDLDGFTTPPEDLRDSSDLPRITDRLMAEGFDDGLICNILGENALNLLLNCWGKQV